MSEARLLLEKAMESLEASELLWSSGYTNIAASRVYYAYFYTAQALLLTQNLEFSRHGQVIAQYGFHFSRTRLLDPGYHRLLATAFDLRQAGDYETGAVDPEAVRELIDKGRDFLSDATRYLEELPRAAEDGEGGEG
jgi:uncharacterized protein (UPF0332 family)